MDGPPPASGKKNWTAWLRLLGPLLLALLLLQLDARQALAALTRSDPILVALSTVLILPLIALKTIRWQSILRGQGIRYRFWPAYVAYFASLFVGFLTPGRLGEFTKALYVWKDCQVSFARSFSGVLVDRLFDLAAVLLVSLLALTTLVLDWAAWVGLAGMGLLLAGGLAALLNPAGFAWMQRLGRRAGSLGEKLFAEDGWVTEIRAGLLQLGGLPLWGAILLTGLAYALYFWQCFLLYQALGMGDVLVPLTYPQVSYAVALGGLVTLLPISISGLGTREAAMIATLGAFGVPVERALAFSLLVFVTFYLGGSLLGGLAWLYRPTPVTPKA